MHDTLKKPQDLLMVSYAIRFPDLAAKSKAIGGDVTMDPEVSDDGSSAQAGKLTSPCLCG